MGGANKSGTSPPKGEYPLPSDLVRGLGCITNGAEKKRELNDRWKKGGEH